MSQSDPQKILFISNGFYPKARGAEIQMENLARTFQRKGHLVEVLTLRYDKKLPKVENYNNLLIERVSYPAIKGIGTLVYLIKFALKLFGTAKKWDVLYVVIPEYLAFLSTIIGNIFKKTVILKFTGIGELGAGYINKLAFSSMLFKGMHKAKFFIAVSNAMVKDIAEYGFSSDKIKLIPNAVDTERFKPAQNGEIVQIKSQLNFSSPFIGLFVGKLIKVKGVDYLVKAWAEFCKINKDVLLLIVGEGPERKEIENIISENKLEKNVRLLGLRKDIPDLMKIANIYILPSYSEGLSNTLLEGMSSQLPIACTRISGNEDLIVDEENGLLYKAGDINDLLSKIRFIYDNKENSERMAEKARNSVINSCSHNVVYNKYMELINHEKSH